MNKSALNESYPADLYRFHEANFAVGISFFLLGSFLATIPIFLGWYEGLTKKIKAAEQDVILEANPKNSLPIKSAAGFTSSTETQRY